MSNRKHAKTEHVLGIDFGTTNSYFCKYLSEPDGHKIRTIDFGNRQLGGMPSTILYRKDKNPVVGKTAEEEWGEASPAERRQYDLHTHFKPDITRSENARTDAANFLKTIRTQAEARRIDFAPEKHQVIIGIPGEAGDDFKDTLKEIATDAGYGGVRLVYEPIGALLYHLWNKDITPAETQRGVLVVDFGGGTCDFAYMQRLEVYRAWGDMLLGGRLFDDLFFQWFLDQNPAALKKLLKDGDEYYVHWLECRRVKELFSETMVLNREENVRSKVGQLQQYGTFKDLTWAEFERRSRNYSPHQTFLKYLKDRNLNSGKLIEEKGIDLFTWFEETLVSGLEKHQIRSNDIERIILTGGSSQWLFVKDVVCRVLKIDESRLLTSENPKAAISEGLVVLPSLQNKYENASNKLRKETPAFFQKNIEPEITRRLELIVNQILKDITIQLYDGKISPLIYDYRENGGSLADLKEQIKTVTLGFMPKIEENIRAKLSDLNNGLPEILHQMVSRWFIENNISYYGDRISADDIAGRYSTSSQATASMEISNLQEDIMDLTSVIVIGVTAAFIGTITGGGQTAIIASGPIGWIIGAIGTAVAGWIAWEAGRDKINEMVENANLPSSVVKMILWESKIQSILSEGREKLKKQLRKEVGEAIEKPLSEMKSHILNNIEREIGSLTLINHL